MPALHDKVPAVMPARGVPGPPQGQWNYEAYAAIPEDGNRYEVIDGVLYVTPAPNVGHQGAVVRFGAFLFQHVEIAGLGRVFVAPTDVELTPGGATVQPDVLVVLQGSSATITGSHIIGAPDLVIEVASPGTATHDRRKKMDAYAAAGVKEYWIADVNARTVELLRLEVGAFTIVGVFRGNALLPSVIVPDLPVRVDQFFA